MISAKDGLWLAQTFRCSPDIQPQHAERLTRSAIEFSKAIIETSRDCPQRASALQSVISALRAAERAAGSGDGL